MSVPTSRRSFLRNAGLGAGTLLGLGGAVKGLEQPKIQGFDENEVRDERTRKWEPVSDRKIRMGIVGYGVCKFGPKFSRQHHPNFGIGAVSDLFPDSGRA